MTAVLVEPTGAVPLSAVSAAAIGVAGAERVWLDTGGPVIGIRVPEEVEAQVRQRAGLPSTSPQEQGQQESSSSGGGAGAVAGSEQEEAGAKGAGESGGRARKTPARRRAPRGPSDEGEE